jgi:hypothetical protein
VELAAEEPGVFVATQFYDFDELAIRRNAAEDEAAFFQLVAVDGALARP